MPVRKKTINDINSQAFDVKYKLRDRYLGKDDEYFNLPAAEQKRRKEAYKAAKERIDAIASRYTENIRKSKEVQDATADVRKQRQRNPYYGGSWDAHLTQQQSSIERNTPVDSSVYNPKQAAKAAGGKG